MFYCEECKGVSSTSHICENPSCPLMPCCGKEEDACTCQFDAIEEYDPIKLQKAFDIASINSDESFFIHHKPFIEEYKSFLIRHIN